MRREFLAGQNYNCKQAIRECLAQGRLNVEPEMREQATQIPGERTEGRAGIKATRWSVPGIFKGQQGSQGAKAEQLKGRGGDGARAPRTVSTRGQVTSSMF